MRRVGTKVSVRNADDNEERQNREYEIKSVAEVLVRNHWSKDMSSLEAKGFVKMAVGNMASLTGRGKGSLR
jgi:hypothetical protein